MEIANERTHRVLAYLAAVGAQGEGVPAEALNAYAAHPDHRAGSVDLMASIRLYAVNAGRAPEESFTEYLDRLGWIFSSSSICVISPLGEAVLQALNKPRLANASSENAIEIVLDPEDAFAYTRALSALADLPEMMIVDPYFRLPQLIDLASLGNITRVLTTKKIGAADQKRLALGLRQLGDSHPMEIRFSKDLHDRYVIPTDGRLLGLGTSLHGVGRSLTVLTTLGSDSSRALRELYEAKWAAGDALQPAAAADHSLPTSVNGAPSADGVSPIPEPAPAPDEVPPPAR